jgi:hypothetical protein
MKCPKHMHPNSLTFTFGLFLDILFPEFSTSHTMLKLTVPLMFCHEMDDIS